MNPDIVYIYSHQASRWRGQELKYSLRSLEKWGRNFRNVVIVGDKPSYLNDKVIHINQPDNPGHNKERKIVEKLITACQDGRISDPFIMFNDDYFLTKEIDFSAIPYYYFDDLANKVNARKKIGGKNKYTFALENTYNALKATGNTTLHFDIHYPIAYEKEAFKKIMAMFNWNIKGGYVIKSLYCNTMKVEGKIRKDCKIYLSHNKNEVLRDISDVDLFSTDNITRTIGLLLNELYPEKCSFETL